MRSRALSPSASFLATVCFFLVGEWKDNSSSVTAFSTTTTTPMGHQREFIEITDPLKQANSEQLLPAAFVAGWPTWVLMRRRQQQLQQQTWERIPDADGFVLPTSIDELWHPQDLVLPQCQLALGLHVRNGQIRHLLPAMDLCYATTTTMDDDDDNAAADPGVHRNRGLCSVPRAYQWMDFGAAMAGGLNYVSVKLQSRDLPQDQKDDNTIDNDDEEEEGGGGGEGEEERAWETLAEIANMEDAVNQAIEALADNPPEALGDGSNIVHLLLGAQQLPCPKAGTELRVLLEEDGYQVGLLQVRIQQVAPGSESQYLPDAYKPLFQNEAFRRPAFVEARKRLAEQAGKGSTIAAEGSAES